MNELDRCQQCEEAMGSYRWGTHKRYCDECYDSYMEWVEEQQKDID